MKKILFISNVTNKITNFSIPSIYAAQRLGYEFHLAANLSNFKNESPEYSIKTHHLDIERNPFDKNNVKAYKQLLTLLRNENFDVIHCNTPVGGLLGRICGTKVGVSKIIYTAHGFHFFKGARFVNRTIFKIAEMIMARHTDVIITMNDEDYLAAKKFKLKNDGKVYFIPGVGVDTSKFNNVDSSNLKEKLDLARNDIILIAMGDLIDRKNYETSIRAIAKTENEQIHFLICGTGPNLENLKKLARNLNIESQIHFLGFRTDIKELLSISDIFLFTTLQEGLPRAMMEAMSAGLPCIASRIRGNTDLIKEGEGGYLLEPKDSVGFSKAINHLVSNKEIKQTMKKVNLENIKRYDIESVKHEMLRIYKRI